MQEKISSRPTALKKLFPPMQILIVVEIALAFLLVLYISRAFHTKNLTGSLSLFGLVITLMQPKYQFGMVWEWKKRITDLIPTTPEQLIQGIINLQQAHKESVEQLRVWLIVPPIFVVIELGINGTAYFIYSVLFSIFSYCIFEIWQRKYCTALVEWLKQIEPYGPAEANQNI